MPTDQPTGGERHLSIDAVRGFAVLGILLMNIVGMGLPAFAYINPVYAGGHQGVHIEGVGGRGRTPGGALPAGAAATDPSQAAGHPASPCSSRRRV